MKPSITFLVLLSMVLFPMSANSVTLAHHNIENSTASTMQQLNRNWNIQESAYCQGGEIVFLDAEDAISH